MFERFIKPAVDKYLKEVFKKKLSGINKKIEKIESDVNTRLIAMEKKIAVLETAESYLKSDVAILKADYREVTTEMNNLFKDAAKMTTAVDQLRFMMEHVDKFGNRKQINDDSNK